MDSKKAVRKYHRNLAIAVGVLILIFALIPTVVTLPYILNIFILVFYMSTLSMAWNLLGGMTGQNSLGHAAYMGLGAYICCLAVVNTGANPWLSAILAMVVVGLVAGIIFFPCFILRGPYFTLVSIAFGESIRQVIINSEFFGRASGIGLPFGMDSWLDFRFASKLPYYYVGMIMLIGVYLLMKKIDRSKMGFALKTIREDEDAAAAMGINPVRYKVTAVVISAMVAALVGFFYASYIRYIDPELMIQAKSVESVLPAVVGGAAYVEGPLVGGLLMIPLSEYLRANFSSILPGINMSVVTEVVAQVCQQYGVPMITAISTLDRLSNEEHKDMDYFFRLCPLNSVYVENMLQYLKDSEEQTGEPIKTVAIFTDRAAIGQELIRCVELFKDEYGIELVATVLTPRSSIPLPCSNTHSVPQNDQPAAETRQADCKRSAPPGSAGAAI